jgi:hypothetical protein
MRNLGLSRRELFEKIERDALIALPADAWEFAEWRRARVNLDYHIEVHDFLYSVPHLLIRAEVDVRITARTVEIFHRGQRVGVHQRRYMGRKHGTDPDHTPAKIVDTLNSEINAGSPIPSFRRDLPIWVPQRSLFRLLSSATSSPKTPRVGQGDQVREHQAGVNETDVP